MISNSGSDEHGRYNSGASGDQTGREWRIIPWYKRPWKCVLRHPDPEVRDLIATLAEQGAHNDKIGYDQYERWTFWAELKKVGYYPKNIYSKCEADCSSGVISIVWAVGYILNRSDLKSVNAVNTFTMRKAFREAGFQVLTYEKYLDSDKYLRRGDILLKDDHHTAINLTNGAKEPEDDEMSYSQFLEYQKQYEKDRAEMGAAEGWQQNAQAFVRDKGISDGNSPQCPAPRVQIWGMLFKFYGVIIADVKQLIREAIK